MSRRFEGSLLWYPAMFLLCLTVRPKDIDQLMVEYLELAKIHKTHSSIIKAHLFHALYAGLQLNSDLRATLRVVGSTAKLAPTQIRSARSFE